MTLGLLVAEKNVYKQTGPQDSCFISIDIYFPQTVTVRIDVHDGYGAPLRRGRDIVDVWLVEPDKGASMTYDVTDLGNGTYLADVSFMWQGFPEVCSFHSDASKYTQPLQYVCAPLFVLDLSLFFNYLD